MDIYFLIPAYIFYIILGTHISTVIYNSFISSNNLDESPYQTPYNDPDINIIVLIHLQKT